MKAEQVALLISILSLAASTIIFVQQRADERRRSSQEDTREDYGIMIDVYRNWLSADEQDCRRALYKARDDAESFTNLSDDTRTKINHAVAMMNLVAILREAERVPIDACDELFGSTIVRVASAADSIGYFEWRHSLTGSPPWRQLRAAARQIEVARRSGPNANMERA